MPSLSPFAPLFMLALSAEQPPAPPTTLDALQVSATTDNERHDSVTTRIVIDQAHLRAHGDTQLSDALRRLPGITLAPGAPGQGSTLALRGLGNGHTQILIDGQPPAAGVSIDSLTPDMVERVELLRAPTADMRTQGIAGTINIVLSRGARRDGERMTGSWRGGSGGHTPSLAWHRSSGPAGRRLGIDASTSRRTFNVIEAGSEDITFADGSPAIQRSTRLDARGHRDSASLKPSLDLQLGESDLLTLQGLLDAGRFKRTIDIDWTTHTGPALPIPSYLQRTRIDVEQAQASARWRRTLADGGSLETRLAVGGNQETYRYAEQGQDDVGLPTHIESTHADTDVGDASLSGRLRLPASERHRIDAGWDIAHDRRRERRTQQIQMLPGTTVADSDLSFDARIDRLAVYAQDEMTLSPRWSLYLGGRWEQLRSRSAGSAFAPFQTRSRVFSPILQSLWRLPGTDERQVRVAFSQTWRAPTLAQLIPRPYTSTNNRELNPDEQGNPALRPELAQGLDIAFEAGAKAGLQFNIGGYLRRIEDAILTVTSEQQGRWIASPVNAGNARSWGVELDTSADLSKWWPHAPATTVRLNATANWSTVERIPGPDNRLADQVPWNWTLSIDHPFNARWSGGLSHLAQGRAHGWSSRHQWDASGGRRALDAFIRWRPRPGLSLRLDAANLLRRDIRSSSGHEDDAASQRLQRQRRNPASVQLQVEWSR